MDSDQDTIPWGHSEHQTGSMLGGTSQRLGAELSREAPESSDSEDSHRRRRMHSHL